MPPRYTFFVLLQQEFVDVNLDGCHDRSMWDRGRGVSTRGCEGDVDVERGFLQRVTGVGLNDDRLQVIFVLFGDLRKARWSCQPVGIW